MNIRFSPEKKHMVAIMDGQPMYVAGRTNFKIITPSAASIPITEKKNPV